MEERAVESRPRFQTSGAEEATIVRLKFVRRTVLAKRGWGSSLLWSVAAVAVATVLRLLLSPVVQGVPFLTYFPAVLGAGVLLGRNWGIGVTVVSAFAANYLFIPPFGELSLSASDVGGTLAFILCSGLILFTGQSLRRSILELDRSATREAELNAELQHRVKNNLAVIQGLADQTARNTAEPQAFYRAFSGRIQALAQAHDVLSGHNWEAGELPELVERALRPFRNSGLEISGPACTIPPISCVPLVLALHELGTNAVKYGALSSPGGRVAIRWRVEGGDRLVLQWSESGGPRVEPPSRRGLGSRLLRAQTGLEAVDLSFPESGANCRIVVTNARPLASGASPTSRWMTAHAG